jgi:peptide/nickel transport system permease protein
MLEIWQRFRRNRLALIGFAVISIYVLLAIFAPLIAPYSPYVGDPDAARAEPGPRHWLGADHLGRDILSRVIFGARISLQVAFVAVAIALVAGTLLGISAGYFGRWIDTALSRVIDTMLSFPDILLALTIMAILGASTLNVMLAIGIVYIPIFARIARGSALQVRENAFVEAARALGIGHVRILLRHILPNITAPLVIQTTLSLAFAILAEAALSFLGLGVEPRTPSWGVMLNQGKDYMETAWWMAVFPGIAITLAVFSFNVMGDGLRDALDPRLKNV